MDKNFIKNSLKILEEEVVLAEGCTEPIALAYSGALLKHYFKKIPNKLDIIVSGNIIKNVKSVIIPNSNNRKGIESSVIMGMLLGDYKKELMVISNIDSQKLNDIDKYLENHEVNIIKANNDLKLYINLIGYYKNEKIELEIKHIHTNLTKVKLNNKLLLDRPCNDTDFNSPLDDRKILSIKNIYDTAKTIEIDKIKDLFQMVIDNNTKIAEEGLSIEYGVGVGKTLREYFGNSDTKRKAATYAAAGSDARMNGCPLPVATTSGSGNQGMTASLPLISYAKDKRYSKEELYRALYFSHLSTVHIKTNVGRLSAYCGVICAGAAVSGALAFINGENFETVSNSITNTLGNISGVICDGAKSSCAMKINSTISAAYDSYILARNNHVLSFGDGIIGNDVESTIKHVGELASQGMDKTDEIILDIMLEK